tara:strand:- start:773 stop:1492 length:720 start_codon:yes stop_codon:yes gene_type:complete
VIRLLLLGAVAAVVILASTRDGAELEERAKMPPEGKPPKKGRTWDLDNWSAAAGGHIPPPGLPMTARLPSAAGAALPEIRAAAAGYQIPGFPEAMDALARNESGGRYALPAWTYDSRPKAQRPPGKSYISAWGAFQWQNAHVSHNFGKARAYQMTPEEETAGAVQRYSEIVAAAGGDPAAAFLWHVSPAGYSFARKKMKQGVPTREAIRQGAASRGAHYESVFGRYLEKWDDEWPEALA